jgi:hypothetical protein
MSETDRQQAVTRTVKGRRLSPWASLASHEEVLLPRQWCSLVTSCAAKLYGAITVATAPDHSRGRGADAWAQRHFARCGAPEPVFWSWRTADGHASGWPLTGGSGATMRSLRSPALPRNGLLAIFFP